MKYINTRNSMDKIESSDAILKGLADDGGLFVPEFIPKIQIEHLIGKKYNEMAFEIFKLYLTDFEDERLKEMINKAYSDQFDSDEKVVLKKIGDQFILELFHGSTLAFKDMALSILPYFMVEAKRIKENNEKTIILTATSGDTGKAALEGFKDIDGIEIIVFYPEEGVSEIQKLQMVTQVGDNTHVVAIKGNFDDAQKAVKNAFSNIELRKLLKESGYEFSSANSINVGRLIPQMVYYFYAYMEMVKMDAIKLGEAIKVSVPTGNFGNILAAYYAKKMGLPIEALICASNENNILTDFINTGVYDTDREFIKTMSPSMDILVSSNLERFLFEISGRNHQLINEMMLELKNNKQFSVDKELNKKIKEVMIAGYSSEIETKDAIVSCHKETGYLLDPHTAVAYHVAKKQGNEILTVSTASPYKFGISILNSFNENTEKMTLDEVNEKISLLSHVGIPKSLENISYNKIKHDKVCRVEEIEKIIKEILKVEC